MFKYALFNIRMVLEIFLVILLTHAVFFIVYSYFICGDPFLALRNFYNIYYHLGI